MFLPHFRRPPLRMASLVSLPTSLRCPGRTVAMQGLASLVSLLAGLRHLRGTVAMLGWPAGCPCQPALSSLEGQCPAAGVRQRSPRCPRVGGLGAAWTARRPAWPPPRGGRAVPRPGSQAPAAARREGRPVTFLRKLCAGLAPGPGLTHQAGTRAPPGPLRTRGELPTSRLARTARWPHWGGQASALLLAGWWVRAAPSAGPCHPPSWAGGRGRRLSLPRETPPNPSFFSGCPGRVEPSSVG